MEVPILNFEAKEIGKIEIPKEVLEYKIREDLVLRDFLAEMSKRRQPYGRDPFAGLRTSAHYHSRRRPFRRYVTQMNIGMARHQRIHGKAPWHMMFVARIAPNVRKGRRAHAPKAEKVWEQKINRKEHKIALLSAIAASFYKELVKNRGHKIDNLKYFPIVVNDFSAFKKTKELKKFLEVIGLEEELERIKEKKIRAGKGKMRGRRYKRKRGPLIIVEKLNGIEKVANSLNIDVCDLKSLNTLLLAPGAKLARLIIWEEKALKKVFEWFKKW